jgi:hypothetical protein
MLVLLWTLLVPRRTPLEAGLTPSSRRIGVKKWVTVKRVKLLMSHTVLFIGGVVILTRENGFEFSPLLASAVSLIIVLAGLSVKISVEKWLNKD